MEEVLGGKEWKVVQSRIVLWVEGMGRLLQTHKLLKNRRQRGSPVATTCCSMGTIPVSAIFDTIVLGGSRAVTINFIFLFPPFLLPSLPLPALILPSFLPFSCLFPLPSLPLHTLTCCPSSSESLHPQHSNPIQPEVGGE